MGLAYLHSLGLADSFECRVSGLVVHGGEAGTPHKGSVCARRNSKCPGWHGEGSQGPFLGESGSCVILSQFAQPVDLTVGPDREVFQQSSLQTFTEHLLCAQDSAQHRG